MSSNASSEASDAELVEALRQTLWQKLNESGHEKQLKDDLRQQLIDCGWRDQVKQRCKNVIKERGMEITVEELIGAVSQPANDSVPETIRADLLLKLKQILSAIERDA
jgi:enhancer of yellow 2 transcription factor